MRDLPSPTPPQNPIHGFSSIATNKIKVNFILTLKLIYPSTAFFGPGPMCTYQNIAALVTLQSRNLTNTCSRIKQDAFYWTVWYLTFKRNYSQPQIAAYLGHPYATAQLENWLYFSSNTLQYSTHYVQTGTVYTVK